MMRRAGRAGLYALLAMSALGALLFFLVASFNWNNARPWIGEHVEARIARRFTLAGDLRVTWHKAPPNETGWAAWLPWPRVQAHDIALANPDWARSGPDMLRIRRLAFDLHPLALLRGQLHAAALSLSGPDLVVEVDDAGRTNWIGASQQEQTVMVDLAGLSIEQGTLRVRDAVRQADLAIRLATRADAGGGRGMLAWEADGKLAGEKISGGGSAGAPLALQRQDAPYPLEADVKIGKAALTAKGELTDPVQYGLDAYAFDIKLTGASAAQIAALTGRRPLPAVRVDASGRLSRTPGPEETLLRFENFSARINASDVGGNLTFHAPRETGGERAILRGELASGRLDLKDVLPLFVGPPDAATRSPTGPGVPPPDRQGDPGKWNRFDARLAISVRQLIRPSRLPLENLVTDLRLEQGRFALAPLRFGMAGGLLDGSLRLDTNPDPPSAELAITARHLKLKALFPRLASMQASVGEVNGEGRLTGRGDSIASLLAAANGKVQAVISEGSVSKYALESMGLNVGAMVATRLFGDSQVQLHCMAADFRVTQGVMKTDAFIIDTEDAIVTIDGQIDLAKETLALDIYPESKGVRLFSLRSPLRARGTFRKPEVVVDKRMMALRAGAALALGAVAAPLAALAPLVSVGPEQDSHCAALLAKAGAAPRARAAGK